MYHLLLTDNDKET